MGVLNWITQGCDALTSTASPSIDALGLHICVALATIMLVWFGVQEALSSAQGGPGFNMAKFLSFFMLITFAYVLVRFYDSSIPGVGYSLRGFINGGAQYLVSVIGNDSATTIQNTFSQAQSNSGPGVMKALMNPYYAIVYVIIQVLIATLTAVVSAIVAYGAVASAVTGLLGPVFIPFLVFDKLEFLFWGWLRAFIGFCFYKVLAAAVLSILGHLLAQYYSQIVAFSDPGSMVKELPLLILLVLVNVYILFKIPALTMSIFSGSTGGHDGGMGAASALALRVLMS
jgi:TrbL/VirB6 plasmid conjugal transfer protein